VVVVVVVLGAAVAAWSWFEPDEADALGEGDAAAGPETVELAPEDVVTCAAVVAAVEAVDPRYVRAARPPKPTDPSVPAIAVPIVRRESRRTARSRSGEVRRAAEFMISQSRRKNLSGRLRAVPGRPGPLVSAAREQAQGACGV
jgi:hypothetical protein